MLMQMPSRFVPHETAPSSPTRSRQDQHRSTFPWRFPPVALWLSRCRERAALAALDARLLRDIEITRTQVKRETGKIFWQR